jgi:S-adenosyl-L-methionine hydrolase (adenosine-forming)
MLDRIALVTDFGSRSPYVGQMRLRLDELLPRFPVVELESDLVPFRPDLAAYFLPALARDMPARTLYVSVVDPGVGSERAVLAVEADGDWYLGPDNGLLALVARRAQSAQVLRVDWRPERLSASFHGRDLFCPIAAKLVEQEPLEGVPLDQGDMLGSDWPDELSKVIYTDNYGNLITGIRAASLDESACLIVEGREVRRACTFCEVTPGQAFWYEDCFGLVELAVNQGKARRVLGLEVGDQVEVLGSSSPWGFVSDRGKGHQRV